MNRWDSCLRWPLGRVLAGLLVGAASAVVAVPAVAAQAALVDLWGFGYMNTPVPVGGQQLPPAFEASSSGNGANVVWLGVGAYQVTFVGIGTPAGGGPGVVHVTAASLKEAPAWCQASGWSPVNGNEVIDVKCYQTKRGVTGPVNTDFTIAFSWWHAGRSPGAPFGYLESNGVNGTVTQFDSASRAITSTLSGPGNWIVMMHGLGGTVPQAGGIQVTPATARPVHCKVEGWTSSPTGQVIHVICFATTGAPVDLPWNLTYQNARDITGRIPVPPRSGYYWHAAGAPAATNFNSMCQHTNASTATAPYTVTFPCINAPKNNVLLGASGPNHDFCSMTGPVPWSPMGTGVSVPGVRCFHVNGISSRADDFFITYTSL